MIGIVCLGLLFLAPAAGRSRWAWPLLLGFIGAALVNLPWIAQQSAVIPESWGNWIGLLTRPTVVIAGSAMSGLLILVGAVRLVSGGSPEMRMARTLERRRDFRGAAELYERAGKHKRAVALYVKDRAWVEAARASRAMRDDRAAASYFRRAGGRHLQDAAAIYRRLDATEDALTCERSLAEWLTSQGHLAESLEAWLRAGDAGRAPPDWRPWRFAMPSFNRATLRSAPRDGPLRSARTTRCRRSCSRPRGTGTRPARPGWPQRTPSGLPPRTRGPGVWRTLHAPNWRPAGHARPRCSA
jgi:hypothetical protein